MTIVRMGGAVAIGLLGAIAADVLEWQQSAKWAFLLVALIGWSGWVLFWEERQDKTRLR